jgi:hypothetical protein
MTCTSCVISAADRAGWAYFVCEAAPAGVTAVVERRRVTTINAGLPTRVRQQRNTVDTETQSM